MPSSEADRAPQDPFCPEDIANTLPWHSPSHPAPAQLHGHCSPWHWQLFTPLSRLPGGKSLPGSSSCPSSCPHHQARPVVALRGRQSPCPWGHHHLVPRWPRATKPSQSRAPYPQPQPWDLPSSQKLPSAFQEPQPQPAVLGIPELLQPSSAQLGEGWNSQHTLPLGAIHGREMELRSHPAQVLPESCPFTPDEQLETACRLPATPARCHPPASSVTTTCRMPFTSPSHRRLFTPC